MTERNTLCESENRTGQARDSRLGRSKGRYVVAIRAKKKTFSQGENAIVLDRNPIWVTPCSPPEEIKRVLSPNKKKGEIGSLPALLAGIK